MTTAIKRIPKVYAYICPMKKLTPAKSLIISYILSPFIIAKRETIAIGIEANLSLRQNIATPKKIKPRKIGSTPKKYLKTLRIDLLIVLKIVAYSLI